MNRMSLIAMLAVAAVAHAAMAESEINVDMTKGLNQTNLTGTPKVNATAVGIDPATRTVTLKTTKGKVVELEVRNEARNFDRIEVGDLVTAEYRESLSLSLSKKKTTASR
jgi:ethanolamine utilization protein EutQ (cupin superfamily)